MMQFFGFVGAVIAILSQALWVPAAGAQVGKKTGLLDRELAAVEERLAELERWHRDPEAFVEHTMETLLDKRQGPARRRQYEESERAVPRSRRKEAKTLAQQSDRLRRLLWGYYDGRVSIETVREQLLPIVRENVRAVLQSGLLEQERTSLEQRRSAFLMMKRAVDSGGR